MWGTDGRKSCELMLYAVPFCVDVFQWWGRATRQIFNPGHSMRDVCGWECSHVQTAF